MTSGNNRVWWLTSAIIFATAPLVLLAVDLPAPDSPIRMPLWLLAVFYYVAEITVVHVRFRRDAHSFSMSEFPLVMSLFFASPITIIAAQMIGSAAALGFTRRQRPVKLIFNLAQLSLQTAVMTSVFWAITGSGDPLGPRGWYAVGSGIACTLVISNALISGAIVLSGGSISRSERTTMYMLTGGAGLMNATLGLVAATILWARPQSSWIAAAPPLVLFFAYRAYLSQRLERERVQALYEVSEELHRLPHIEDALEAAVDRARVMFDAETAEILLYPEGLDSEGISTTARIDEEIDVMGVAPPATDDEELVEIARSGTGRLISDTGRVVGMIVPIPGTGGVLRVTIPRSDIGGFGERDLQLLSTLAGHVGISLENGRLEDSLTKLTELKDQLRYQALHDGLTGLANRSLLLDRLVDATSLPSGSTAVLFLDLDDFKGVNDGHGHEAGDALLVQVARRLEACCRPTDTVARLGGDEFALLVTELANPDHVVTVARRVIEELSKPFHVAGTALEIHASIGVAVIDRGTPPDEVLKAADEAMYVAKGEGKGTYRVYSPGLRSTHSMELSALAELRAAIREERLVLHYQPIFNLSTGRIEGVEALVRWDHPERGLISPDEFVPLAERRGVVEEIGDWVLRKAADALRTWRVGFGADAPYMSVNFSAAEIAEPALLRTVLDVLAVRDLDPASLQIEITEGAMMDSGTSVLDGLRRSGVRVALDDFGTGYSSLAYLDQLPVDTIKLARGFVDRIGDPRVRTIIEMMVGVGETLGFSTIAEGVERQDQLDTLRAIGCEQAQGYHLARPMPEAELMEILAAHTEPNARGHLRIATA